MSVTFSIAGTHRRDEEDHLSLNLNNRNAADLLAWLGLPAIDLWGEVPATDLAARCRRRLWPEPRNHDPGLPDGEDGRVFTCGRPPGYLRERTQQLLELCELAGDGVITYG